MWTLLKTSWGISLKSSKVRTSVAKCKICELTWFFFVETLLVMRDNSILNWCRILNSCALLYSKSQLSCHHQSHSDSPVWPDVVIKSSPILSTSRLKDPFLFKNLAPIIWFLCTFFCGQRIRFAAIAQWIRLRLPYLLPQVRVPSTPSMLSSTY